MKGDTIARRMALRFLDGGYGPDDWIAVFLKCYQTGRTLQRIVPVALVTSPRFQAWLRAENAAGANVYVSVNAVTPGLRSRRRDAMAAVRHVFLDIDANAAQVLTAIESRPDLPSPSCIVRSSPGRAQVFWWVRDVTCAHAEALQKLLAREVCADPAATACSQTGRLPGFFNHKYQPAHLVSAEYGDANHYRAVDFPTVRPIEPARSLQRFRGRFSRGALERARRYIAAVPPAIAGQHGDLQTFRVCCRLVRGFALTDVDALEVLSGWNIHCEPPWSESELRDKLRRAREYGREPIGGLLEERP